MSIRSAVLIACLAAATGCARRPANSQPTAPRPDTVTLYEGLPHQMFEKKLLASELATKPVVRWADFPFYAQAITPSADDAENLRTLLTAESTFKPYGGPKKCGGYHPDWAVEIGTGDEIRRALICFGCEEVKVLEGASNELFDLSQDASTALGKILPAYRKNRPQSPLSGR